ncbi:MAG: hypothetical protein PWP65_1844, partial [Clostridia bacterium]|nr:hypothetical protein [Clostridia bacterium]
EVETQLLAARYDYQILLSKFHYRLFDPISSQSKT